MRTRLKIIACSHPDLWYADKINLEFDTIEVQNEETNFIPDGWYTVNLRLQQQTMGIIDPRDVEIIGNDLPEFELTDIESIKIETDSLKKQVKELLDQLNN